MNSPSSETEVLTLVVDRVDVAAWLQELNGLPGIKARVSVSRQETPNSEKNHPFYSLDYSIVAQIVVSAIAAASGVATVCAHALTISEKIKEKRKARAHVPPAVIAAGSDKTMTLEEGANVTKTGGGSEPT